MGKKLFIGNLSFSATESSLSETFSSIGTVESAKIISDRETGRSKGFGFIEMSTDDEAAEAIAKFNGFAFEGRPLAVTEAKPMAPRDNRGGGGGGGGYGGGGGGGGRGGSGGGGGGRW